MNDNLYVLHSYYQRRSSKEITSRLLAAEEHYTVGEGDVPEGYAKEVTFEL